MRPHAPKSGTTVLELVAALAALSLAFLLGTRLLHGHLRQLSRMTRLQTESAKVERFQHELERQWEARCADPFHPGEWLRIEGEPDAGWILVSRIWIRLHGPDGRIGSAELKRAGDAWQWDFSYLGEGSETAAPVNSGFEGRVRLRCPATSYSAGDLPERVVIELEDDTDRLLAAFAIVGHW